MTEAVLYDAAGPRGRRRILIGSLVAVALVALVVGRPWPGWPPTAPSRPSAGGSSPRATCSGCWAGAWPRPCGPPCWRWSWPWPWAGCWRWPGCRGGAGWPCPPGPGWSCSAGLPLLLLILFLFLGLPAVGVTVSTFWALVAGLTLYNSAVIGEIFRAGILSLPKGQTEAAYSIGLRRGQTLGLILIPQAVRLMLPALISQAVTLLKDTSLGFVIAYAELLRTGRNAVEFLGGRYSIPVYTAIAVIYIAVNASLSFLARWLDRRTRRRLGRTVQPSVADEAA